MNKPQVKSQMIANEAILDDTRYKGDWEETLSQTLQLRSSTADSMPPPYQLSSSDNNSDNNSNEYLSEASDDDSNNTAVKNISNTDSLFNVICNNHIFDDNYRQTAARTTEAGPRPIPVTKEELMKEAIKHVLSTLFIYLFLSTLFTVQPYSSTYEYNGTSLILT